MKKKHVSALKQLLENFQESISKNLQPAEQMQTSMSASRTSASELPITEIDPTTKKDSSTVSTSVIRDTFSIPSAEYQVIEDVRLMAAQERCIYNKSEILRAALFLLSTTPPEIQLDCLSRVERLKPGRK